MFRNFYLKIAFLLIFCGFHIAYGKDRFSAEPEDQTVRQGEQVTFVCQLAHARDRSRPVVWIQNNNNNIPDEPRFRVIDSQADGEYRLIISNAQAADSGYYGCELGKGRHMVKSRNARLEVVPNGSRQQHAPYFVAEPSNTTTKQGERVVLECALAGLAGQVQWLRDGSALGMDRNLPAYPRYSIVGNEQAGKFNLMLNNVQVEDDADFVCESLATDQHPGLRTAAAHVTVLVPPETPIIEEAKASIVPVILGKPVMLTCRVKGGKPTAKISWLRDGQPVVQKISYMVESQPDGSMDAVSTVKVTANRRDHGRRLECIANSVALTDPSRAFVIMNVQYAPHVTMSTNATRRMYEHKSVTFSCEAVGNPNKMKWKWSINGEQIDGETSNKYAIGDVSRDYHHRELSCEATNRAGTNKRSFKFNILFSPTVSISANVEGDVKVSQRVVLTCDAKANPGRINWRWYKNKDDLIEGKNTQRLDLGRIIQDDDGSMIRCEATNRIGTNSSTYTVKIAEPETTTVFIPPTTQLPSTTPEEVETMPPEDEITTEVIVPLSTEDETATTPKAEVEPETTSQAEAELEDSSTVEATTVIIVGLPEAESETEPTSKGEAEEEPTPEAEAEVDHTPEAEAEVDHTTEAEAESETTPAGEAEIEPVAEGEAEVEIIPAGEAEAEGSDVEGGDAKPEDSDAESEGGHAESEGGHAESEVGDAESEGGAAVSEGGTAESEGGAAESEGGAVESEGGAAESEGGAAESEGGAAESEGGAAESEGGAAESKGDDAESEGHVAVGASKCEGEACGSAPAQTIGSITLFTMVLLSCSSIFLHSLS